MSVYVSASYGSQITLWGIFSSGELSLAAAELSFVAVGEVLFNSSAYIRTRLAVWLVFVAANLLSTNFAVTLSILVSLTMTYKCGIQSLILQLLLWLLV